MISTVKAERQDDQEINEMARKIVEQNRAKLSSAGPTPGGYSNGMQHMQMARPGQPGIQNYLAGRSIPEAKVVEEKRMDEESRKGHFGWCEFEKNYIPYIFRNKGDKFTSVRMVERKLLNKFLVVLPPEVNSCHCIRSYFITDSECKLLNEINLKHADCHYGKEAFTSKDLVVKLKDAKEFFKFLDLCHKKLVLKKSNSSDRCGFFRINGESVVPYTVTEGEGIKYVPLFYFEGETDHLKLKSETVEGWDLAYLKFCCKVQGVRNELFASDVCRVVALDEIKQHFPQGTTFEDYWPAKGSIEPVHAQRVSAGNWTQKPATAGIAPPVGQPKPSASTQMAHQQAAVSAYNMATASARNSAAAAAQAVNNMAYDVNTFQQLLMMSGSHSAAQQQQQQRSLAMQQADMMRAAQQAAACATLHQHQQLQLQQQQAQQQQQQHQQAQQQQLREKTFNGKLTQIKEFPIDRSNQPPYKLQKALIDQKIVPCINVRPYVFNDLMMTLPDFVRHFYSDVSIESARKMLQDILKVVLYKGNTGHQDVLRKEGKCIQFDPVPLILVKDVMSYMPQLKYMIAANLSGTSSNSEPASKRMKVS